jgi:hypothetical protein
MIGVATEATLGLACEQRLGRIVRASTTFSLIAISSPWGRLKPRKPLGVALALTDDELYLLELRNWAISFKVGAALCHSSRDGLVAQWRHRWWGWPEVWKAELSWPEAAIYVEGALMNGKDSGQIMGLLAADDFDRERRASAPARRYPE